MIKKCSDVLKVAFCKFLSDEIESIFLDSKAKLPKLFESRVCIVRSILENTLKLSLGQFAFENVISRFSPNLSDKGEFTS